MRNGNSFFVVLTEKICNGNKYVLKSDLFSVFINHCFILLEYSELFRAGFLMHHVRVNHTCGGNQQGIHPAQSCCSG